MHRHVLPINVPLSFASPNTLSPRYRHQGFLTINDHAADIGQDSNPHLTPAARNEPIFADLTLGDFVGNATPTLRLDDNQISRLSNWINVQAIHHHPTTAQLLHLIDHLRVPLKFGPNMVGYLLDQLLTRINHVRRHSCTSCIGRSNDDLVESVLTALRDTDALAIALKDFIDSHASHASASSGTSIPRVMAPRPPPSANIHASLSPPSVNKSPSIRAPNTARAERTHSPSIQSSSSQSSSSQSSSSQSSLSQSSFSQLSSSKSSSRPATTGPDIQQQLATLHSLHNSTQREISALRTDSRQQWSKHHNAFSDFRETVDSKLTMAATGHRELEADVLLGFRFLHAQDHDMSSRISDLDGMSSRISDLADTTGRDLDQVRASQTKANRIVHDALAAVCDRLEAVEERVAVAVAEGEP